MLFFFHATCRRRFSLILIFHDDITYAAILLFSAIDADFRRFRRFSMPLRHYFRHYFSIADYCR